MKTIGQNRTISQVDISSFKICINLSSFDLNDHHINYFNLQYYTEKYPSATIILKF